MIQNKNTSKKKVVTKPKPPPQVLGLNLDNIEVVKFKCHRNLLPKKGRICKIYIKLEAKDLHWLAMENNFLCIGFFTDDRLRDYSSLTPIQKINIKILGQLINLPNLVYEIDSNKTYATIEYIEIGYVLDLPKNPGRQACYKFPILIENLSNQNGKTLYYQILMCHRKENIADLDQTNLNHSVNYETLVSSQENDNGTSTSSSKKPSTPRARKISDLDRKRRHDQVSQDSQPEVNLTSQPRRRSRTQVVEKPVLPILGRVETGTDNEFPELNETNVESATDSEVVT